MKDYQSFVDGKRTLLIAPAGYGKTYTIVESLKYTVGRQLILTHTHAGIISIKEKIKELSIANTSFRIETISSFIQKYVNAFYSKGDIPEQDSKEYYPFLLEKAIGILKSATVQHTILNTYSGLFVDEYQDCSRQQHTLIMILSDILPTHVLGDPLQGIFDFNGESVDMNKDLHNFEKFPELETPYRWYKEGNDMGLGDKIKEFRALLQGKKNIELVNQAPANLFVIKIQEGDLLNKESNYRKKLDILIRNVKKHPDLESALFIVPEYEDINELGIKVKKGDINYRALLRAQIDYTKSLTLLESIDDKSFYSIAKGADDLIFSIKNARKQVPKIKKTILEKVFNKTELNNWFNNDGFKRKKTQVDKNKIQQLKIHFDSFIQKPSPLHLLGLVLESKKELKLKYKRDEILRSFMSALKKAHLEKITVYDAIKNSRNQIRRSGRKINGKCLGTTLLTKGLEFDTVIILDAHKFTCHKNLYVALTRCCKKLVIFTANTTLSPYP